MLSLTRVFTDSALFAFMFGLLLHSTACSQHRKLLQKSDTDCGHLHKHCTSCAAQAGVDGTVVACLACTSPSYRVTADARTCECSPGYFPSDDATNACSICGRGSYCSGADTPRQSCGALLTTLSATASNHSACITLPGVAYMSGASTATKCPVDTYNIGGNKRNCTECPGELVTSGIGAASIESCEAPPGFFYRSRQAIPCAIGSFKPGINKNSVCQACPEVTSTSTTYSNSSADCKVVIPGYEPIFDSAGVTIIGATRCPIGTYSTDGQKCTPCITGLTTKDTKSTAASACTAPPGYGYYPDPLQVPAEFPAGVNVSSVIACPTGWFKEGYSLGQCITCGVGFLTNTNASSSPDACYIPAGWGSKRVYVNMSSSPAAMMKTSDSADVTGTQLQLVATKCNLGNYGAEGKVFGQEPVPCQPCPEHTTTPDAFPTVSITSDVSALLMTSIQNCSNIAGYGWQSGIAAECPIGFYSPGYNWAPCLECGMGLTTVKPGRTGVQDCVAKPGWQLVAMGLAASCPTGAWSAGGSQPQCTLCSVGSTTVGPASSSADDCSVCLPGWGVPAEQDSVAACAACDYGAYSPGGASSFVACELGHTSAKHSADSTACVPIWSKVDPYSSISAPESALRQVQTATDASSCQDACGASTECQFYVFRAEQQNQTQNGCYLKDAAAKPLSGAYIAFKLVTNIYTVWGADADNDALLGNSVTWAPEGSHFASSAGQCLDACDASASCLGIWTSYDSLSGTWECRLMGGQFRHRESTAIHVIPARINDAAWAQGTNGPDGPTSSAASNGTTGDSGAAENTAATDGVGVAGTGNATDAAGNPNHRPDGPIVRSSNTTGNPKDVITSDATGNFSIDGNSSAVACIGFWSTSSLCSAECGGNQSMVFAIFTPAANGGSECAAKGGDVRYVPCSTRSDCPDSTALSQDIKPPPTPTPVDCVGAWFPTSPCTGPCGNGTATVTYLVTAAASNNGIECQAADGASQTFQCDPCQGSQTHVASTSNSTGNDTRGSGMQPVNVRGWNPALNSPGHVNTNVWPFNNGASNSARNSPVGSADSNSTSLSDLPPAFDDPAKNTIATDVPFADIGGNPGANASETPAANAADGPGTDLPAGPAEPATNITADNARAMIPDAADASITNTLVNGTANSTEPAIGTPADELAANTPLNDTADSTEPAASSPSTDAAAPANNTPMNGTAGSTEPAATTPADDPALNIPVNNTAGSAEPAASSSSDSAAASPATHSPENDTATNGGPSANSLLANAAAPASNIPVNETADSSEPATTAPTDTRNSSTSVNDTVSNANSAKNAPAGATDANNITATNAPPAEAPATNETAMQDTATDAEAVGNTPATDAPVSNTSSTDALATNQTAVNSTASESPATSPAANSPVNGTASSNAPAAKPAKNSLVATDSPVQNATDATPRNDANSAAAQPSNSTVDGADSRGLSDTTSSVAPDMPAIGLNKGVSAAAPYLGCFQDIRCFQEPQEHALPTLLAENYYSMAVALCVSLGQEKGMHYVGLQYYGQCWGALIPR